MIVSAMGLPAVLIAALIAAAPAAAQSQRIGAAWDAALSEREGVLADPELARLNLVAYHSAVARLCEGFDLDLAKIGATTDAILAGGPAGLDGDQMMARQADILILLGTAHGIFLAEGALSLDAFCAEATEARSDPEFSNLWE